MNLRFLSSALTFCLVAGLCSRGFAQSAATPAASAPAAASTATVSLEECIRRALANSFDLEISRYNPQIAKENIAIAEDPYEPVVAASASRSHSQNDASGSVPRTTGDQTLANVSVTQQLYTGTTVTLSSQLDRSHAIPTLTALNPAYNADLTVSVRQQLLQGFGIAANRAAVHSSEAGFQSAQLTHEANVLNIVQNTENAYYLLVFAQDQLEVHQSTLELAQVLFREAQARKDTGVATELDVFTASVAVQNARRQVLLDEQSLKDSRDALLAIIGRFELDAPLSATKLPETEDALPVYASSFQMAMQTQPDYLAASAAVEQAKYNVESARNNSRPNLSVGGAVGLNATRGSYSSAVNSALADKGDNWQLDVSLSYPWGQVGEKARLRQSQALLNQSQTRLRSLEQTIQVNVRSAVRAVETNHESVKISVEATALAVKQYELQKAKFDAGLATSREVLQAQTDLETARLNELQSRISLRNSYTTLHRVEGSALKRLGLAMP